MITRQEILAMRADLSGPLNPETEALRLGSLPNTDVRTLAQNDIDRQLFRSYHADEPGGILWKIPPGVRPFAEELCQEYATHWTVHHDAAGYLFFYWD